MSTPAFIVRRSLVIAASREVVYRYFTDSERFARWWGAGSTIEAVVGGSYHIRYPNGSTAGGQVIELMPPERIVLSWGYDDPAQPIARGGSRVVFTLSEVPEGTLLQLAHEVDTKEIHDAHVAGWRYQLAVFAHVVNSEQHADAARLATDFLRAWNELHPASCRHLIESVAAPDIIFQSMYGCTQGIEDLVEHIGNVHKHMAGITLAPVGTARRGMSTVLSDWEGVTPAGNSVMKGTNVIQLAADGRIKCVTSVPA